MNNFKAGEWVIGKAVTGKVLYRIDKIENGIAIGSNKNVKNFKIGYADDRGNIRHATNNDYFNTLTPEQKAKWITFRYNTICSLEYCKSKTCITTDCVDAVSNFLKDFYNGWEVK